MLITFPQSLKIQFGCSASFNTSVTLSDNKLPKRTLPPSVVLLHTVLDILIEPSLPLGMPSGEPRSVFCNVFRSPTHTKSIQLRAGFVVRHDDVEISKTHT
jgi:hypothetical protein